MSPPIPTPRPSGLKLFFLLAPIASYGSPNTYAASKRIETFFGGDEGSKLEITPNTYAASKRIETYVEETMSMSGSFPQYLRRVQAD